MKLGNLQRKRELATQTKTKTKTAVDDSIFNRQFFAPDKAETETKSLAAQKDDAKKLSRSMAAADSSNMPHISADSLNALTNANDEPDVDYADAQPEPTEPNTLPAVIKDKKALYAKGMQKPNWLTISQLPGYMQRGIRMMGKVVFKTLTSTPLEEIHLMVNLQNGGPNEAIEMNAVGNHAKKGAGDIRDLQMAFGEMVPGYEPKVKMYIHDDQTYLLVRDDMGDYIYSWPTSDNADSYTPMDKIAADNKKKLK